MRYGTRRVGRPAYPDPSVEWVLERPTKLFVEQVNFLAAHLAVGGADAANENPCLLYGALTRAKRAMFVIAEPVGAVELAEFSLVVARGLEGGKAWHEGEARWFDAIELRAAAPAVGEWSVQAAKEDEAGKGGEDEHAGQRVVYPRVVAMLVGISPERVMCEVVFTRLRRRVLVGF